MGKSVKDEKLTLLNEIAGVFNQFEKNGNNRCILDYSVDVYDTLYLEETGEPFVFSQKETKKLPISELTESELYDIYAFLDANKHTARTRETLIELEDVADKSWYKEPEEIRNGDDVVGMIGIAVEETIDENKALLSVIFISPDGTYSTLTMFGSDSEEERKLAFQDLRAIAQWIDRMCFELCEIKDNETN